MARWLQLARKVSRRRDLAVGSCIAAVALIERLLGPVLVHVAAFIGTGRALVVGGALTAIFALRSLIQSAHVASVEAGLYFRVVDSVLRQDVLQPSVLPNDEARDGLFEGAHEVARLLGEGLPNLCANAVAAMIFAVFAACTQSPRLIAAAGVAGWTGIAVLLVSRRFLSAAQRVAWSTWSDIADAVTNAFDGRIEIVAGGRADDYLRAFDAKVASWRAATVLEGHVLRFAGRLPLVALAASVGVALLLEIVLQGPSSGRLPQAVLLASMAPAFVGTAQGLQDIAKNLRRLDHMLGLVTIDPSLVPRGKSAPAQVQKVEFRDVHFSYGVDGRRLNALQGVSLTWQSGEVLALTGANGSGKSTCLRVLLGLGRPSGGDVLLDSVPLERIDLNRWRRSVAFLPQRPYLLPRATLRRCLQFVDPDFGDDVMMRALERVGLESAVRRRGGQPLDVRVGELSVGQRQRVALARLLCRDVPWIVLDEPDANLDRAGLEHVATLIRELAANHSVIMATHSPDLLAAADRVVTLDSGRISSQITGHSVSVL